MEKGDRDTQTSWDREIHFKSCFVKRKYAFLSPANNPSFRVVVASVATFRRVRIVHEYLKKNDKTCLFMRFCQD